MKMHHLFSMLLLSIVIVKSGNLFCRGRFNADEFYHWENINNIRKFTDDYDDLIIDNIQAIQR